MVEEPLEELDGSFFADPEQAVMLMLISIWLTGVRYLWPLAYRISSTVSGSRTAMQGAERQTGFYSGIAINAKSTFISLLVPMRGTNERGFRP